MSDVVFFVFFFFYFLQQTETRAKLMLVVFSGKCIIEGQEEMQFCVVFKIQRNTYFQKRHLGWLKHF